VDGQATARQRRTCKPPACGNSALDKEPHKNIEQKSESLSYNRKNAGRSSERYRVSRPGSVKGYQMDKENLKKILIASFDYYAGGSGNFEPYVVIDEARDTYIMLSRQKDKVNVVLMAQIVENQIRIIRDQTDRPWEKRLMNAGIPAEQIIWE
jgi:hypothetical protein